MKTHIKGLFALFILFTFILFAGCSDNGKKDAEPAGSSGSAQTQGSTLPSLANAPDIKVDGAGAGDIVVSVDGNILTKAKLESETNEKFNFLKSKVAADKQKEFRENLKKQLVEIFILRTLLSNEIAKKKIEVSNQEVKMAMDSIKASLPPTKKIDEFLKENKITQEDIIFAVQVEKLKNMEIGQKAKPTQKEISKFYNDNKTKLFTEPESVHVRHILVTVGKDDSEKVKADKKEKIESIRKQLLNGGDFADLARKNSDCPSKEVGGDLSYIKKGQMVKAFENAAFSQQKNAIGPVVISEYGYHVIQVLDRKPEKKVSLDEAKAKISTFLEQRKKVDAFNTYIKGLRDKAKITIY